MAERKASSGQRFVVRSVARKAAPRLRIRTVKPNEEPHAIADMYRRRLGNAYADAVQSLVVDRDALARGLSTGVAEDAMHGITPQAFEAALVKHVTPVVQQIITSRATQVLRNLVLPIKKADAPPSGGVTGSLSFTLDNPLAIQMAQTITGDLIRNVSESSIEGVRAAIGEAIRLGVPPRAAAGFVGSLVGLRPQQIAAVMAYREGLIEQGLKADRVAELTEKYGDRLLRERGLLIARTETIRAGVAGTQAGWDHAVKAGFLDSSLYGQQWLATDDDRTCPECEDLDGDIARLGEPFPDGSDGPPAHPGCRCDVGITELPDDMKGGPSDSVGGDQDLVDEEGDGGDEFAPMDEELDAPTSQLTSDATSEGQKLLEDAAKAEPQVTLDLASTVDEVGGNVVGMQADGTVKNSLKGIDSLSRKIEDKVIRTGASPADVAQSLGDVLRYTAELPPERMETGVIEMIDALRAKGYTINDRDIENTWDRVNAYHGINVSATTRDGQVFELQFHTAESFRVKSEIHDLYELFRKEGTPARERWNAYQRMVRISNKQTWPKGIANIGRPIVRPFAPTTIAKAWRRMLRP